MTFPELTTSVSQVFDFPYLIFYILPFSVSTIAFLVNLIWIRSGPINIAIIVLSAFLFLGLTIGILSGASRTPVMHATIPALLGFLGGGATYLYSKDKIRETIIAAVGIVLLSISVVYGSHVGSKIRWEAESIEKGYEFEEKQLLMKYQAEIELAKAIGIFKSTGVFPKNSATAK